MRVLLLALALAVVPARADVLRAEDFPESLREAARQIAPVWKDHPDDPSVLYQVAALYARAQQNADALAILARMERTGAGLSPRPRDGFAAIADDPGFQSLIARLHRRHPPVLRAKVVHTLAEGDLLGEGMAYSQRTGELYLGSFKRKIIAFKPDGEVRELVPPGRDGFGVAVGLRVDDRRGELWAVSEVIGEPPPGLVVGVFRFHLPDGALIRAYPVPKEARDLLNDLAVAGDGAVYVTSTNNGALIRIDPDTHEVGTFLPPGSLPDPNGITVAADGNTLYVAGWYAVSRVDRRTKQITRLAKPRGVADGCFDGLYAYRGDLIGVQNCVHEPGRILRLHLSPDGRRILRATVLESSNPLFNGVTTGAIAGDRFYFPANVQFRKMGTAEPFDPVKILELPLR